MANAGTMKVIHTDGPLRRSEIVLAGAVATIAGVTATGNVMLFGAETVPAAMVAGNALADAMAEEFEVEDDRKGKGEYQCQN